MLFTLDSLPKDTTIYGLITHRSKSGITRYVKVFIVFEGNILDITYNVAKELKNKQTDKGIKMVGCGIAAVQVVVHNLGFVLHGDGYYFTYKGL